jgi:tetratricopeptide (TPR) repeat protein
MPRRIAAQSNVGAVDAIDERIAARSPLDGFDSGAGQEPKLHQAFGQFVWQIETVNYGALILPEVRESSPVVETHLQATVYRLSRRDGGIREISAPDATLSFVTVTLMAQAYTPRQAIRQAQITPQLLRAWQRSNLVPSDRAFTAEDLAMLRGLAGLHRAGVRGKRMASVLAWIETKFGSLAVIRDARIVHRGRRSFLKLPGQEVELLSGQLRLRFDSPAAVEFAAANAEDGLRQRRREAEQWFQRGLELEQAGSPVDEVIAAYRKAVELDERSAGAFVNLGTIYFNARMWRECEKYYRKAIDADPNYALAHFNLANLYDERGLREQALVHYEQALRLKPSYADAHYNLALLFQGLGQTMKALKHWKTYLRLDPSSSWAAIARREIRKLQESALVEGAKKGPPETRKGKGASAG